MDHSSYLKAAEHLFRNYYQSKLIEMDPEDEMAILINEFAKDTKILKIINQNRFYFDL